MSLETQVADLTTATTELTNAVLFKKASLDTAVASAEASAIAAAASAASGGTGGTGTGGTGSVGATGATGAQGIQGIQGIKGDTGSRGTDGIIGVNGTQGVAGVAGAKGDTGAAGLQGTTGTQGAQGVQGTIGLQGATGANGIQGVAGTTGAKGDIGITGAAGINGTSVSLKGAVATIGALPSTGNIAGDLWVVSADGNGYVWSGSSWSSVGAIQGPAGNTGETGATGATGTASTVAGAQGIQGLKGDTGIQGVQGATGVQGLTGITGSAGAQGVQGLKGDTGAAGTNGTIGATGLQGATGSQGATGMAGADSTVAGVAGTNGIQGIQGVAGTNGIIGVDGVAGAQGIQGLTGATGATGTVDPTLLTNEVARATAAENLKANQATTYTKTETDTAIQAVIGAAPLALNTLVEIAAQLATDETAASALTTAVSLKAPIANPTFTGTVSGVTATMVGLGSVPNLVFSGSNTGDETLTTIKTKLGVTTLSGSNTGDQVLPTVTSLGLNNVSNTSDASKPVSTAQATAIALKMTNPFTTAGDLVYAGVGLVPTRLAGSTIDNQVLTNHPNGTLSWQNAIPGQNATVNIGAITTVAAGTNATVTNSGDTLNAVLNFSLPQGPAGVAGLAGSNSLLIAPLEQWYIVNAAATGTVNIDIATASVWLYTLNATSSFIINVRGSSSTTFASKMAIGQSCTVVFGNTSGSVPFYPSAFNIDGVQYFPKWSGGLSPNSGNSNAVDMYAYVIVRTGASSYSIFANQTKFA